MEERYSELANQLGNLVSRVATMSVKYFNGQLDDTNKDWSAKEAVLETHMKNYDLRSYIDEVFTVVSDANELTDKKAPFKLIKEDEAAAKAVLSELTDMIRFIGISLLPIMPQTAEEIIRRYGKIIEVGESLFPRRD